MRVTGTELAIRAGGAVVVTAGAVVVAVVEAFLVPFTIGPYLVPLAAAAAFAGNWALAALAVWWVRGRWAVLLTAFAWFAVMMTASLPTEAGSLVITADRNGYLLLLAGTAGIAVSLWQYFRPKHRPRPSVPKETRP